MLAGRHQEVTRTFGGRCRDNRCLIFAETICPHAFAHAGDHVRAQDHVLLHHLTPQIEVTIFQAGFLGVFLIAKHLQRQLCRGSKHFQITDKDLNFAGGQFGVHQISRAGLHLAVNADTELCAQIFNLGKHRTVGVAQYLRDPIMVAQVDEDHTAMVAAAMHPARQADRFANICGGQGGAGMAAIGVHQGSPGGSKRLAG